MYSIYLHIHSIFQAGKPLFPRFEVILSGLENKQIYEMILEFVPIGNRKYQFLYGQPRENGNAEPLDQSRGNLIIFLLWF